MLSVFDNDSSMLSGLVTIFVDFITLSGSNVLHYRESITLLGQNIINDILQDIPLVFQTAILKKGIRTPLGVLNGMLAKQIT